MKLTMLTRAWCHLCDEMLEAVRPVAAAAGASVALVDVDLPANAALEARWGDKVPVLFAGEPSGGVELCRHRFDGARVNAALAEPG